jgi:hypothetical protein
MKQWAEAHVDEVLKARAAFDRAQARGPHKASVGRVV